MSRNDSMHLWCRQPEPVRIDIVASMSSIRV